MENPEKEKRNNYEIPLKAPTPGNATEKLQELPENTVFGGQVFGDFTLFSGSQHPSPNVKTLCNFETQIWLEIITSRDVKTARFKGSRTSCRETICAIFGANFGQKRSHHVMDAT